MVMGEIGSAPRTGRGNLYFRGGRICFLDSASKLLKCSLVTIHELLLVTINELLNLDATPPFLMMRFYLRGRLLNRIAFARPIKAE